jgi:resuscitation-promoting factor RpfA
LLATLAVLVALSGGPDYHAIAQRPVAAPANPPPPAPAGSAPAAVLASDPTGDTAHVAEVILAPPDPRLAPALDWYHWDRLAECETGGRWDVQGPRYGGGLQILSSTWRTFGGTEFADLPGHATREQQIVVGRAIAEAGGWRQWPGCAKRLGL